MNRRTALQLLAAGAAWPASRWLTADLEALGVGIHTSLAMQDVAYRAFDARTAALVVAASERILPADDTPGALEAQVPRFIDTIMADWEDADVRDAFVAGLATLDRESAARHGRPFAECSAGERDAILTAIDDEVFALPGGQRGTHWFARLKSLTVYGYCTSEAGMRQELGAWPRPGRYDGNAPYAPRRARLEDRP